jgi:G:T-mismatch repair DNA endonuclease (very short patch repair protein)
MEQTDGLFIKHARSEPEYRLPELPHFSVDGYCAKTNTVYEFFGCYFHGCTCQPFRDVITTNGDNLAARYERTMARLEQITRAGYQVKVQWQCLLTMAV